MVVEARRGVHVLVGLTVQSGCDCDVATDCCEQQGPWQQYVRVPMSSLNATQADGYYVPPTYFESGAYKKQSLSKFAGSKGHNQYLQRSVVRFELPFDGFCTNCSAHVGKGTRFNAHKAHVDDYFTTKIYEFTTKCRACAQSTFTIRTNPKERTFDYVEGIRKKVEEFDTTEAETAGVIDTDVGAGIIPSSGPVGHGTGAAGVACTSGSNLSRLEQTAAGERKAQTEHGRLESIQRLNDATSKNDAASNASLRATYRRARQGRKRRIGDAERLGLGRSIELSEVTAEDNAMSREVFAQRKVIDGRARKQERESFQAVRSGSIFDNGTTSKSGGTGDGGVDIRTYEEKPSSDPKPKRRLVLKSPLLRHYPEQDEWTQRPSLTPKVQANESSGNGTDGEVEMRSGLLALLDGYGSDES